MKQNRREEQALVGSVLTYLLYRKIPHAHIRNTGSIIQREGKTIFVKPKFSQRGVSDIVGCWKGVPFAIELKSKTGSLSEFQSEWLDNWMKNGGGRICVANDLEQVEQFLEGISI